MKKLFSLFTLLALLTAYAPGAIAVSENPTNDDLGFTDLDDDDPSRDGILWLQDHEIVEGYSDGTFDSLGKINRAEFTKIVVGAVVDAPEGSNCFSDVAQQWFAPYICHAQKEGWISGYDDDLFKPSENINFAEASKVVINAFDINPSEISSSDDWYREFVEPIANLSAIPLSISDLDKDIYRGEMAEVVWRLTDEQTELAHLVYEELIGMPVEVKSCNALKDTFLHDDYYTWDYYEWDDADFEEDFNTGTEEDSIISVEDSPSSIDSDSGSGSTDYSATNVQVEGVDEADIVKTDGEYIYLLKDYTVRIIKAYPVSEMEEVATIDIEALDYWLYPDELYIDGDTLVVLGNTYTDFNFDYGFDEDYSLWFNGYHNNRTGVMIYDISDPENPEFERWLQIEGNYSDSRKVDDTLYLITENTDFQWYAEYELEDVPGIEAYELLPLYYDSMTGEEDYLADCDEITYFPRERDLEYLIVSAIPLETDETIESEVMIGSAKNVYSARENLYVTATNYDDNDYYFDSSNARTFIYKFNLEPGNIEYQDRGKVDGTILNQFSMDEYDDHFRIAATQGGWLDIATNHVYTLNSDMEIVGTLDDIAPGEAIYSTRFVGETLYMVTFETIDPLFVIDLSDPENPEIKGELKIPGFSTYLHPFGDDYLLGFGRDTVDNGDWASVAGFKIGLFDVSDPENPKELFVEVIGEEGTYSELLYNHKALLFDEEKGLLAFPITVADSYWDYSFIGAYVYSFDIENGFNLTGTISHYTEEEMAEEDWYWSYWGRDIDRVLYIDDTLYSTSSEIVKANDLTTVEEVNSIEL